MMNWNTGQRSRLRRRCVRQIRPELILFFVQHSTFRIQHLIKKCPEMSGNVRFPPGVSPDTRFADDILSVSFLFMEHPPAAYMKAINPQLKTRNSQLSIRTLYEHTDGFKDWIWIF
jgi:hypothetical protein